MALSSLPSAQPRTASPLSVAIERLSDSLKIKRGSDGPASLVVAEQQRASVAAVGRSIDTLQAASGAQTGNAAFEEGKQLLQDARDLALASAGGTVTAAAYSEF